VLERLKQDNGEQLVAPQDYLFEPKNKCGKVYSKRMHIVFKGVLCDFSY